MITNVRNYIDKNYPTISSKIAAAISAAAASEMTFLALRCIISPTNYDLRYDFSGNLGGAVFYALCAAKVLPGSEYLGGISFCFYSIFAAEGPRAYVTSKIIGFPLIQIITRVILPIFEKLGHVLSFILERVPLANHPIWYCVALLGFAVLIHRVVIPYFSKKDNIVIV